MLTKSTLGIKNWNNIVNEMADWTHEMKNRDQTLQNSSASEPNLPPVRQMKSNKLASSHADKNIAGPPTVKRAVPRDYSEWDKFDADKEILKMELEDERKREQIAKNKKVQDKEKKKNKNEEDNSTLKVANNLSSVEKEYMATQEKNQGNEYYHSGDFEQAVNCYSKSIMLCPTPAAYNNRAMAQLKLQKYVAVIEDCNQVLEAEPLNVKALHRRGIAHKGTNCYEQAYEDFFKVMELEPDNQAAKLLADQMKRKLEPAVKTVRLSIEEECYQPHGFVFPSPKSNVPVNEWGLAKVVCRCNGIPAWAFRQASKCKVCQRKRVERKAKREEEAEPREVAEMSEVNVSTNDSENPEIDQMQIDEKGSGDVKATEKIIHLDTGEDYNMQAEQDNECIEVEVQNETIDIKMNDKIDATVESTITNDEINTTYTCNIINKENSNKENDRHKDDPKNNINSIGISSEVNKSNPEFGCDTKVLANQDVKKAPKEVKQKTLVTNDNSSGKQMKVQIANKYKKNIGTERETASEIQESEGVPTMNKITSPFEFVKVWESLKLTSDLSSHTEILRSIKPSDLVSVIGNKLDGRMLSTILMCLEKNFASELVLEYLNNIMKLPRFNIVIMFLETPEKQAVCRLLENLENSGIHPSGALWKAFTC